MKWWPFWTFYEVDNHLCFHHSIVSDLCDVLISKNSVYVHNILTWDASLHSFTCSLRPFRSHSRKCCLWPPPASLVMSWKPSPWKQRGTYLASSTRHSTKCGCCYGKRLRRFLPHLKAEIILASRSAPSSPVVLAQPPVKVASVKQDASSVTVQPVMTQLSKSEFPPAGLNGWQV